MRPRLDPLDVAWAAGFIDGEGWIGIPRKDGRGHWRSPSVEASQVITDAPLLKLQEMFGGSISDRPESHRWVLSGSPNVRLALAILMPHLLVKRAQAEVVLGYALTFEPCARLDPIVHQMRQRFFEAARIRKAVA